MARKRRPAPSGVRPGEEVPGTPEASREAAPAPAHGVPGEVVRNDWTVAILAGMLLLAPALGVPSELMLQDTLKSMVVAFCALGAALLLFVRQRARAEPVRWHGLVWLPLMLALYALGSMVWSHPYLGGVEAVRWSLFALLLWLGLNTLSRERLPWLAWGVHWGAVIASVWTALQFWFAFDLFPQGPNPASTFINRNFFAEFAVCTLPFSWILLARARRSGTVAALSLSTAFVVVALFMTGTRSALVALWLQLLVVLPLMAWRCRGQLAWGTWPRSLKWLAPALFIGLIAALGPIPTGNKSIADEGRGITPVERALKRTQSIGPQDASLGIRTVMWRATMNILRERPLTGVGAGAWESEIPLYQAEGSQLETDYYAHNEFLQLMAEYGLIGWAFLALLLAYLMAAGWRAWRGTSHAEEVERPWRAVFLCSVLALLIVSNIGFPWRLSVTGALFALCLAGLAASDARLGYTGPGLARPLRWTAGRANAAAAATAVAIGLAFAVSYQAAEAERKLVTATKMALSITASGQPNDPRWNGAKAELLQLVQEGIAIHPHYRKITPMVADELARWGDWRNAIWVWESVLRSRPHIVAIISNVARGYSSIGQPDQALAYLERAKRIQPRAPSVRSLEVVLLARAGEEAKALQLAKEAVVADIVDYDLLNALFILASRAHDFALAEKAMELRMQRFPDSRARGHIQLGALYGGEMKQPQRAVEEFRKGLAFAPPRERAALASQIPAGFRAALGLQPSVPAGTSQTSASSK